MALHQCLRCGGTNVQMVWKIIGDYDEANRTIVNHSIMPVLTCGSCKQEHVDFYATGLIRLDRFLNMVADGEEQDEDSDENAIDILGAVQEVTLVKHIASTENWNGLVNEVFTKFGRLQEQALALIKIAYQNNWLPNEEEEEEEFIEFVKDFILDSEPPIDVGTLTLVDETEDAYIGDSDRIEEEIPNATD